MRLPAMAALGFAAYAVFLAATAPASFLAARANAAAPGRIELADPHGTLWSGNARARIRATGGDLLLDRIEWRFLPARPASGRIPFDVTAAGRGLDPRAQAARGLGAWEVPDFTARGDAAGPDPPAPAGPPGAPRGP